MTPEPEMPEPEVADPEMADPEVAEPEVTDAGTPDAGRPMAPARGDRPSGPTFWIGMAVGAVIAGLGARNLWEVQRLRIDSVAKWFVGGALAVDLLIVPIGAAIGLLVRRLSPSWTWPVLRSALLATAVIVGFALPLVLDQGGNPRNPSLRPRNYDTGLLWALVAVWLVAGVVLAATRLRSGAGRRPAPAT